VYTLYFIVAWSDLDCNALFYGITDELIRRQFRRSLKTFLFR